MPKFRSVGPTVKLLERTQTDRWTNGTENITSSANVGGKEKKQSVDAPPVLPVYDFDISQMIIGSLTTQITLFYKLEAEQSYLPSCQSTTQFMDNSFHPPLQARN